MSIDRREFIAAASAMAGAAMLPLGAQAQPAKPKPLHILILGGTGLTGPHQVRYALSRGHKVTLFNRGRRPKEWPAKVEELVGDREVNDYKSLVGRKFDVCIDNPTSVPHWIRDAAAVLKGNVNQFVFISTLSAYAKTDKPGDETAERAKYEGKDAMAETIADLRKNMRLYGPLKALSEDEAHKQFPGMTTVIRPGLIVGPGDETDRFTYWPVRVRKGGKVLTPPHADPVQLIDSRDLAEWTIRMVENRSLGDYNAIGPDRVLTMGEVLKVCKEVSKSNAEFVETTQKFIEENKIAPWGDFPLWVPGSGETAGFHRTSYAKSVKAGLTYRPLNTTVADTLTWWDSLSEERKAKPRAGLKPEREAELLAKWKA
ncbi:MAG: epimerase [Betaproteobacteria bacterium]|nr:epimerase [Betaproteobacteria bacterium]